MFKYHSLINCRRPCSGNPTTDLLWPTDWLTDERMDWLTDCESSWLVKGIINQLCSVGHVGCRVANTLSAVFAIQIMREKTKKKKKKERAKYKKIPPDSLEPSFVQLTRRMSNVRVVSANGYKHEIYSSTSVCVCGWVSVNQSHLFYKSLLTCLCCLLFCSST